MSAFKQTPILVKFSWLFAQTHNFELSGVLHIRAALAHGTGIQHPRVRAELHHALQIFD